MTQAHSCALAHKQRVPLLKGPAFISFGAAYTARYSGPAPGRCGSNRAEHRFFGVRDKFRRKSMKKAFSVLLILSLMLSVFSFGALAEGEEESTLLIATGDSAEANAFVTISVAGEVELAYAPVTADDLDGNGVIDVNEVLTAAHDAYYPGGATAGYEASESDWGLAISMLWGDTSYAFGYYVDNAMAWSLGDPVAEGGYVYAYVYSDAEYYSDLYSYFDKAEAVSGDGSLTLTLYSGSFDENWNVVFAPAPGAVITVDGEATAFVTDENGVANIQFASAGEHLVSAVSESAILVPAICKVAVESVSAPAEPAKTAASRTYTVQEGDYLWKIAQQFYGTGFSWDAIYRANADIISNPSLIYVGQVLVIPD